MDSRKYRFNRSVFRDITHYPYDPNCRVKLYRSTKDSEFWVQRLTLAHRLPVHGGCVNCVCWGELGDRILSGSDDQHLVVTDPFSYKVMGKVCTAHRANIFSAKYLPNSSDTRVASCSGEGSVIHTDLSRPEETSGDVFTCHNGTAYDVVTIPGERDIVLSCGEDATVRCFDMRVQSRCLKFKCHDNVLVTCRRAATALAVNPVSPWELVVGCADSTVALYDRRQLSRRVPDTVPAQCLSLTAPGLGPKALRITSLVYHERDSSQLLVSYSSDHLYLFDLKASRGDPSGQRLEAKWTEEEEEEEEEDNTTGAGAWSNDDEGRLPAVRRLRLRGDWSDTGPLARPHAQTATTAAGGRGLVQGGVIQRMSDVLSRMLNDPATRAALNAEPLAQSSQPEAQPTNDDDRSSDMEMEEDVESISAEEDGSQVLQQLHPAEEGPGSSAAEASQESEDTIEAVEEPIPSTSSNQGGNLSNEIHSMFDNIEDRLRKKPTVNLTYSDKGSTASTISMTVDDQAPSTSGDNLDDSADRDDGNQSDDSLDLEEHEPPSLPPPKSMIGGSVDKTTDKRARDCKIRRPRKASVTTKFIGHRNARTMIKEAAFWGDKWVMSGSDCGHVLVWEKDTGRLVMMLQADAHVVNCVRPHPRLPILATAGIDYDIKLWAPSATDSMFDSATAQELMSRNAIMLEETKDTITVPATFMIRILACLNQLRSRHEGRGRRRDSSAGGSSR